MNFRISALPAAPFAGLTALDEAALAAAGIRRMTVDACPGYPCRVSLEDAPPGATVYLLNWAHLDEPTPYRSAHAIFVREGATQAHPEPGEVPDSLRRRHLAVRAFDAGHDMRDAVLVDGRELESAIGRLFGDAQVDYLHVHNAARGCYAARVDRA